MVTAILTAPLDVLRTRLQSDFYRSTGAHPRSELKDAAASLQTQPWLRKPSQSSRILLSTYKAEGWRSLFSGLGPSLVGIVPATAIKFYTYGNCKRIFPNLMGCKEDASQVHMAAAATAGVATATATNPIWLVKTRLQLDRAQTDASGRVLQRRYRNSVDCAIQVCRQEGVRGLYRGLSASYLGVVESTLHLVLYERLKERGARSRSVSTSDSKLGMFQEKVMASVGVGSAAGAAKLVAGLLAYPHEVRERKIVHVTKWNRWPT